MSPQFNHVPPIPADTNRSAKAVYSQDDFYLRVGDHLDEYAADLPKNDALLAGLTFQREHPFLGMITIFQFKEKLSDGQASEATRIRLDWKYALHLSLNFPGLPANVLCEYRRWLLEHPTYRLKFKKLIDNLYTDRLIQAENGQSVDAAEVLDEVCSITRVDQIAGAFQSALEVLATFQPEWLKTISLPHWYLRSYDGNRGSVEKLAAQDRRAYMESLGAETYYLLGRFKCDAKPEWGAMEEIHDLEDLYSRHYKHLPTCKSVLLERCRNC